MAKATAVSEKPAKLAKKKSQDLKADAPAKAKKTKAVEDVPAATTPTEPSSSKPKKAKKSEDAVKKVAEPAQADAKKGKKKESAVSVEQPKAEEKAEVVGEKKRKRKAAGAAVEETNAQPAKEVKKRRASVVEPAPGVEEKKVEESGDKKKKRKSVAVEDKSEESVDKSKKKRKDVPSSVKAPEPVKETAAAPAKEKKSKAKAAPEPEPEPEVEAEEAADAEVDADAEDFYGFESDDDDSSDEEMAEDIPGIDIGKLPTVAKDDETVKRKLEKAKRKPTDDRGVIYLGRIPHGFYEDQMRAYFSQFGTVTRLRLSRNKKTGKPKHYGFIEFDSSSVAQIVAETMDNYLLMGHILTCKVIPKDQVHPELWVGASRKWRPVPRDRVARVAHNKPRTEDETAKAEARLLKRQEQRKRKLEEAGIKYDFEAVAYKKKPKATEA
ncbi:RNA-binding domain-containing protein [Lentinus tigrinus ALCF2SS1-7]|uniref:RNA-binding domain-containing protein n=1 Tax=Lentinus tigrinus ALCF2SS1-6 TaxID=1328759 RepID=A0A5C2SD43_9APHY|nr:RNA-binding domain-containing protein [Lentinus tigrinus ALCF2SS1-6]RPD75124.1 RNA-binding domain-containing protein [Lentinus tigrinus ALCF2SS1-7]